MKIFRYEIPVDDQVHSFMLTGPIVHVEAKDIRTVEFWAEYDDKFSEWEVGLQVFGTGHDIPDRSVHIGTTSRTTQGLIWHLIEVHSR